MSSGGKAPAGQAQSKYGAFSDYDFLIAPAGSTVIPVAPASTGDQFQLLSSGSLKEPTLFTIVGTLPVTGTTSYYVFFTPSPVTVPVNGDVAQGVPAPKNPRWLGAFGHVTNMTRSYSCPGGPDTLSLLLRTPPELRTDALNPGRVIQVWRGASCVWEGKLNEPSPSGDGWTVTAHGAGQYGEDFAAIYATWNADDAINRAIGERGLRWVNPGIGQPAGIYLSQQQDSGSETLTAHLNLLITGGGLLWMVTPGIASSLPAGAWSLGVFPFNQDINGNPTKPPDRILVSSTPIARTIAADVNVLFLRYQATADIPATSTRRAVAATFAITKVLNLASVQKHGPMESYLDVSSAGVLSLAKVQAIGQNILTRFVRASFATPFTVGPGQVMNTAGTPVDLGADQAGLVYQVVVTSPSYGGEVVPGPVIFMSGAYEYDEDTGQATVTPFQSARHDLQSLIAQLYPQKF